MKKYFSGKQLKAAMDYRKILVGELAEKTGISRQTLSTYRNMVRTELSEDNAAKIADVLNFPKEFFYVYPEENQIGSVFFRSLLKTKKAYQAEQRIKMDFIAKIYSFLDDYIEFPVLNLPDCSGLSPKEAAQKLRQWWGLGEKPLANLVTIVEKNGIVVSTGSVDTDTIDAFSTRVWLKNRDTYSFIIFYSDNKRSAARIHFDIAHELGHICLHQGIAIDDLEKNEFIECENEANEFASEFLLPEHTYRRDFISGKHNMPYYSALKRKWCVSIQAMLMRSKNLGLLDSEEYKIKILTMQKRGQIKREPLDDDLTTASPGLLKSAILLLLKEKCFTPKELIKTIASEGSLPIYGTEIDILLNLPSMTLGELDRSKQLFIIKKVK